MTADPLASSFNSLVDEESNMKVDDDSMTGVSIVCVRSLEDRIGSWEYQQPMMLPNCATLCGLSGDPRCL